MKLRGDELIGMDILHCSILASLAPILGKQGLRDWQEAKLHRQSSTIWAQFITVEADITEEISKPKISKLKYRN